VKTGIFKLIANTTLLTSALVASGIVAADNHVKLASIPVSGTANGHSLYSSLSADGRYLAYQSASSSSSWSYSGSS